ncbi:ligand-binding sensor domain-containing protein [Sedimenticola sp.]|uniref:ligand-binding sensor domain-containing protein n=1 Tax=Sedimenticola sp. TaxID=1940285 RepID=UPI003D12EC75
MKAMILKALIALVLAAVSSSSFSQSSTPTAGGHTVAPGQPSTAPTDGKMRNGFKRAASGVQFAHFRVGNRNVKAMLSDGPIVWVGTSGGVIRYDTRSDQYRLYDVRSGLLSNGIFHLSKLGDRLLVGTYGGGLSILDEQTGTWENYNIQDGLADAFIYDMLTLDNGDIWIATWSGANRVRGGRLKDVGSWDTYTVESTQGGLPNDWVYGLAKGKHGEVWMATEGGLARFSEGKWTNWKHEQGLGADYELVKDQIDFTRDPAKESSHHARQKAEMGLTNVDVAYNPNYIVSLLVDRQGAVWAGTWGGGLSRFDGTEWKTYTWKDGLPSNHIFMLGHERNGRIWVGTSNGLARWDGEKFRVFTVHDGLYTNNIFSMANAPDGSLWIGGFGGVSRLIGLGSIE